MNRLIPQAALAAFVALAACSDPNQIANASLTNEVDTVTLYSLSHGTISQPSAYSIASRNGVRTWEAGINFEFVYDVDSTGASVLVPIELLGLLPNGALKPGLKRPDATATFDALTKAPLNGYTTETVVPVAVGDLFYIRSTVSTCSILSVPLYAKVEILSFDTAAKTMVMRVLANQNCGYRGLKLGIPKS